MEEHHVDMLMGVILPYVNFFMFLGAAVFFFRKMAVVAANKKRTDFEKLMTEARSARDAAEKRLDELKRRQAGLDKEIAEIMAMSKGSADVEAAKIQSDAERLSKHLRDEARRIADAEVEKARSELRREIVNSVRDSVTKKIKSELNNDSQLKLVKGKIGELRTLEQTV